LSADPPFLEWNLATRTMPGETESGDLAVVTSFSNGAVAAAIDGLGHGAEAARVARQAVEILRGAGAEPVDQLVGLCHEGLKRTRGVVMAIAAFDSAEDTVTWLGVGNVEGRLISWSDEGEVRRHSMVPHPGIVGYRLPALRPVTLPVRRGDVLILATDGVRGGFADPDDPSRLPKDIAEDILEEQGKDTDDALVVVARYLGGEAVRASLGRLQDSYAAAFDQYLAEGGEAGLRGAYEIGREAVKEQLSVLELAAIHHAVLAESLSRHEKEIERVTDAATQFFLESLSAFEMVQRGFWEATEVARVEREVAQTLQRRLLPERLPDIPDVPVAARYLPGGVGVNVGGDWYDVLLLPDERIGLAVGDVLGRGADAASVMGQVRMAFRAYALHGETPETVVERMDALIQAMGLAHFSTMIYLVLDPRARTLRMVRAGHPPPLLIPPGGPPRYLEAGLGIPLGVAAGTTYQPVVERLDRGSILLLYTDGLVETRQGIDEGLSRLQAAVGTERGDVEAMCDRILDQMVGSAAHDDVALVAVRLGDTST
jgi:serine phosphatase RsbU (regulator of sigma subunit)